MSVGILDAALNAPFIAPPKAPLDVEKSKQKLNGKTTWIVKQAGKKIGAVIKDTDSATGKAFLKYLPGKGKDQTIGQEAINLVVAKLKAQKTAKAQAAAKPAVVAQAVLQPAPAAAANSTGPVIQSNYFPAAQAPVQLTAAQSKGIVEAANQNLSELVGDMQKECEALEMRLKETGEMAAMLPPKGASYPFYNKFDIVKAEQLLAPAQDQSNNYKKRQEAIMKRYTSAGNQDPKMAQAIQTKLTEFAKSMKKMVDLRQTLKQTLSSEAARSLGHTQNLAKTLARYERDFAMLKNQLRAFGGFLDRVNSHQYDPAILEQFPKALEQLVNLVGELRALDVAAKHLSTHIDALDAHMTFPRTVDETSLMVDQWSVAYKNMEAYGKVLGHIEAQDFHLITKDDIVLAKAAKLNMQPIEKALKAQLVKLMARPLCENVADDKLGKCVDLLPDHGKEADDLLADVRVYQAIEEKINCELVTPFTAGEIAFIKKLDPATKKHLAFCINNALNEGMQFNPHDESAVTRLEHCLNTLAPLAYELAISKNMHVGKMALDMAKKAIQAQKVAVHSEVIRKAANKQFDKITKEELRIVKANQKEMIALGFPNLEEIVKNQVAALTAPRNSQELQALQAYLAAVYPLIRKFPEMKAALKPAHTLVEKAVQQAKEAYASVEKCLLTQRFSSINPNELAIVKRFCGNLDGFTQIIEQQLYNMLPLGSINAEKAKVLRELCLPVPDANEREAALRAHLKAITPILSALVSEQEAAAMIKPATDALRKEEQIRKAAEVAKFEQGRLARVARIEAEEVAAAAASQARSRVNAATGATAPTAAAAPAVGGFSASMWDDEIPVVPATKPAEKNALEEFAADVDGFFSSLVKAFDKVTETIIPDEVRKVDLKAGAKGGSGSGAGAAKPAAGSAAGAATGQPMKRPVSVNAALANIAAAK